MRKTGISFLVAGLLSLGFQPLAAPEGQKTAGEEIRTEIRAQAATYDPAGRRDPFKNLLGGKEVREKTVPGAAPQIFIDDLTLVGIVKDKNNKYTAVVTGPHGFPLFWGVGEKLSDGYLLSITDTRVVFRKVRERGIPLLKPRDIVKEINPEER